MVCNQVSKCYNNQQLSCRRKKNCRQLSGLQLVCRDKGSPREYRLTNDTGVNIVRYHVDGGIYYDEDNTKKCDFLLIVGSAKSKFVFVELKGGDVAHGMDQLTATITRLRPQLGQGTVYSRMVYSGGASGRATENTPAIIDAWKRLKKTLNIQKDRDTRFKKKTSVLIEKVSEL